ncbi:MAG: ABC transporter permease [Pelagimonas sp.]|jgi:putative spermidine/putrescine transport system permease protein|nr:ABC transporter permease [Pelagimonas sp.]
MSDASETGRVLSADGTPLKKSLNRALRMQKTRALMLIAPLLIFVLVTFIAPIVDMLWRSVENQIVSETLPRATVALEDYDAATGGLPSEAAYQAIYFDLAIAAERKLHTRLGSRLNYEMTGMASLFRKSGRKMEDIGEFYLDQYEDLDKAWGDRAFWGQLMGNASWFDAQSKWKKGTAQPGFAMGSGVADALPRTAEQYQLSADFLQNNKDKSPLKTDPWATVYTALYLDLAEGNVPAGFDAPGADQLRALDAAIDDGTIQTRPFKDAMIDVNKDWGDGEIWQTVKIFTPTLTSGYFLNAADMQKTPEGTELRPDDERIYGFLFKRTLFMSMAITFSCIMLAYPVSYLLSNLPSRSANLLMILVLLPFWTSLLVRTSAWKVMLQQQGVINDTLVWLGLVADDARLAMINNQFGTIVAMTHILLPFMILPMYSVMSTIPHSYTRAAKSLGATNWTTFWRVYFPQSVPGIGAGSILVFILAIGYYITPEIVGGTTGTFISNRIAYHISSSLNWGLAAALGSILLAVVLILYWAYDKIVGIDNVKLGG